jgi:ABC-2 type transport system permease protein
VTGALAVYRREMLALWVTPLAWVLLVVFLLIEGATFYAIVVHFTTLPEPAVETGPLQSFFGQESVLLLITLMQLSPALSMRSFAEERRSGTIETLLTAPVSAAAVVFGKYCAMLTTFCLIWTPTALYVLIVAKTSVVDAGSVASSYLGLLGVGATYLAIGTLMSSLTKSQLVALLLTIFVVFGLFVLGIGEYLLADGVLRDAAAYLSIGSQLEDFSRGIIDSRRLVLDLSLVALCLFLCTRVVESWSAE